ncbi:MAG: diacylglycerol kinase family protein [Candidatus Pacearchaeota archaeon]
MIPRKIGVIFNPRARLAREGKITRQKLEQIMARASHDYSGSSGSFDYIIRNINFGNADDIYMKLQEFKNKDINIVAIAGGDGTLHRTISQIISYQEIEDYPKYISILKSGTQNIIAKAFGFGDAYSTLEALVKPENELEVIDALTLEIKKLKEWEEEQEARAIYGFNLSGLAIANFILKYQDKNVKAFFIKKPSKAKMWALILKGIVSGILNTTLYNEITKPARCSIILDDKAFIELLYNIFVIGSIPVRIAGFNIFDEAKIRDENKIAVICGYGGMKDVFKAWLGNFKFGGLYYKYVKKVMIEAKEPLYYAIDGEIYHLSNNQKLLAKPGKKIKIIRPKLSKPEQQN